tara:strand:+ start:379 stop:1500 length:1122 start_codon:yes stop_codon:yes gene_type:complete
MTRASDTAKLLGAGATILDGTTISTADNTTQLTLTSTDADANVGPSLNLYRNSASPADADLVGNVRFQGENSAGETIDYVTINGRVEDVTDGTEDARIDIRTITAGADVSRLKVDNNEIVLNDSSIDSDFRVESNGNANMLFVDGGNNAVGIGNNNPADYGSLIDNLVIGTTSGNNGMTIVSGTDGGGRICFADNTASPQRGMIEYSHGDDAMLFNANGATRMKIDSTGAVTKPLQPAFLVQPASEQSNIAEGSDVVVVFGTERFDNNADFASNVFTAPVTGKYLLTFNLVIGNVDSAPNYVETYMSTSNRQYASTIDPRVWDADALYWAFPMTVVADMDASDTAQVKINIHNGGTVQADIVTASLFSGALLC